METNCARYNYFPQMKGRKWGYTFEFPSILPSEHRLIACLISQRKRKHLLRSIGGKGRYLRQHMLALFTC